ncbi:hypothetical protein BDB00DRAFT_577016 [Zychaea mexicana]|uniref:uncharacterized protein n=1 Tax=Zychaea mexicana TaxID=64656 RepID=UPI0022FE8FC8|nr:uncharacterized protein BDB00DRAFT_577016 [Zychaea mexicana]KAI9489998.1 hypothetical protein BDB00DRAFT_577016 [Zychaea mexicana]
MPRVPRETKVLLGPLQLYRQILRVHRYMPPALRSMGDDYVKSEFRRHQNIDNPAHIIGFISQWQDYLETLEQQTAPPSNKEELVAPVDDPLVRSFNFPEGGWGKKLDSQRLDKLSDEQLGQLYELRNELKRSLGSDPNKKD